MGIENLGLRLDYQDIANFGPNMSISIMLFYVNAICIRELLLVIFSKREEKNKSYLDLQSISLMSTLL